MRPRSLRSSFLVLGALSLLFVLAAHGVPPPREPIDPVDPPPSDPPPDVPPGDPVFLPAATCPDGSAPLDGVEAQGIALRSALAVGESPMTVAVVDRVGNVLALFRRPSGASALDDRAVGLARTGAFFSNNQAPLSSRTVRFLSGLHFPAGIRRTANAALYGIENTNRGCALNVTFLAGKSVPPARRFAGGTCQAGGSIVGCGTGPVTGKTPRLDAVAEDLDGGAVDGGGFPLFRGGKVVGGIGVATAAPGAASEFAAFSSLSGAFAPPAGEIFLDGIRLPFVAQRTMPAGSSPGSSTGGFAAVPLPAGECAPEGDLIATTSGTAGAGLAQAEVAQIVAQSIAAANRTRAAIRLPLGSRARMAIAVADLDGRILALHRMPDTTVFSLDVAVAKARNVVYFSAGSPETAADLPGVAGRAVSNRTINFVAQHLYPPGIDGSGPGPFLGLYQNDFLHPCSQGSQAPNPNQNGIVFFAGSIPLYKNGALVGGLGISGDGVEQDDYVSFLGAQGFLPPEPIWADRVKIWGARLPFLKFPRNPER
ncbi:MAG TPA: heme-binding protein [Thermoanaerobaculia bacterium]|jgi:uncharacterized protein GlcG (DUF336 family)|nr:heme-binding protein [Thermoanaerobaculia bacterium]